MYGAKTAVALGAVAVCIGISGCAGVTAEVADEARQESAALRVDARSGTAGARRARGDPEGGHASGPRAETARCG